MSELIGRSNIIVGSRKNWVDRINSFGLDIFSRKKDSTTTKYWVLFSTSYWRFLLQIRVGSFYREKNVKIFWNDLRKSTFWGQYFINENMCTTSAFYSWIERVLHIYYLCNLFSHTLPKTKKGQKTKVLVFGWLLTF